MKYPEYPSVIFTLCVLYFLGAPIDLFAQNKASENVSEFLIVIQVDDNEVELSCKKGCAWKDLSFNITSGKKTQAIDQYGMASVTGTDSKDDPKLANFLFTIKITEEGLCLQGKEGTAWKSLKFGCPENKCSRAIDQKGTAEFDEK